jgi:uncharacterized membrane protein
MKYIMKVRMPINGANEAIKDPQFGHKMNELLTEIKAEAAYFTTICGQRGAYIIVNLNEASDMAVVAEPFFLWLNAEVTFSPVMKPEDLAKAGPAIGSAVKKWGNR